ncbi:unnamed protein product [Hermetia illucens]|uniref:Uncharacterized protein n=1 Tax=Hermetia illucens TaxID=343691 RepID=A0A7R8YX79_HERIL|nr:unnamed protein product [Hermetia illucens]
MDFSEADLQRIKAVIGQHGVATQSIVHLNDGIDSLEVGQLRQFYEVKLSILHQFWDEARRLHQDICESTDDVTALSFSPSKYLNIEDVIQKTIIFLDQYLENLTNYRRVSCIPGNEVPAVENTRKRKTPTVKGQIGIIRHSSEEGY